MTTDIEMPVRKSAEKATIGVRRPRLVIASGRGKTGKSVLLSWLAATCREDLPLRVIDADPKNQTLAQRCSAEMPDCDGEDRRIWIEAQFDRMVSEADGEDRHDMLLDLGGGDLLLRRWGQEIDLVEALTEGGVDPVLVHMLGPDQADLRHMSDLEDGKAFSPPMKIVVLNSGLIPATRGTIQFEKVMATPEFQEIIEGGARVAVMPALHCMREFEDAGLTFANCDSFSLLREKLGTMNARRVRKWWREDMPEFRKSIEDYLP